MEERQPDERRAEVLAGGLDKVKAGVLRRWEKVERAGREDGGRIACCEICLDELLDVGGDANEGEKGAAAASVEDETIRASDGSESAGNGEGNEEQKAKETKIDEHEVLAFPCAHAFHKKCLMPWLGKLTSLFSSFINYCDTIKTD